MKRTTIKLPDDVDRELREEATRRGITISELTREAITAYLPQQRGRRRLLSTGAGRSDGSDTAQRLREILADDWPDAIDQRG